MSASYALSARRVGHLLLGAGCTVNPNIDIILMTVDCCCAGMHCGLLGCTCDQHAPVCVGKVPACHVRYVDLCCACVGGIDCLSWHKIKPIIKAWKGVSLLLRSSFMLYDNGLATQLLGLSLRLICRLHRSCNVMCQPTAYEGATS